jgi:hypothetical protein
MCNIASGCFLRNEVALIVLERIAGKERGAKEVRMGLGKLNTMAGTVIFM